MSEQFKSLVLRQDDENKLSHQIEQLNTSELPDEDILVDVDYSSVNYKDALAITGSGKIVTKWPMVPGIDLAGTVVESSNGRFQAGDKVVLTGWGVGERYWGGYSQKQRVRSDWLVKLPPTLSPREAMAIGTAGLTAMLCVMVLEEGGVSPDSGAIAVSGASGGVGSIAVSVLAKLGYEVVAISGKESEQDYLVGLGAKQVLAREAMTEKCRPLEKSKWAGAIDTVGSSMLARLLAETDYGGTIAATGLAGGFDLNTTVMPFILRNVRLQGVDSVMCPIERREQAWARLAQDLPKGIFDSVVKDIALEEIPDVAARMMAGETKGRHIVDLNA